MIINKKLLFNPKGSDDVFERSIVNGNTTNLLDLSKTKYNWAAKLYKLMMENFWIPEKIELLKDRLEYQELTSEEQFIYDNTLSSLIFLDSLQTNNLPNISDYITAPEINLILAIQTFQEAVHSQSYGYLTASVIPEQKMDTFFDTWKINKTLNERNTFLLNKFQTFLTNPSQENFFEVLITDYVLEGICFYIGFNLFYEIAMKKRKMFGTVDIIKFIHRDEISHVVLFSYLIKAYASENNIKLEDTSIIEIFKFAVNNEKKWIRSILENTKFCSLDANICEEFIEYIANERLIFIGMKPIYSVYNNPLKYLEQVSGLNSEIGVKSNFFESNVTSYNMSTAVEGWDDLI